MRLASYRPRPRVVAAGLAAVLAIGVGTLASGPPNAKSAPELAFTRLDGRPATLASFRGKVLLVNFWATSCSTCLHEMPAIVALHEGLVERGFETLAVAMRDDPPAAVVDYAESRRLPFEVAIDNTGAIAAAFGGVAATPTSVLVDRRGRIVARWTGEPDFVALRRRVVRLLDEG